MDNHALLILMKSLIRAVDRRKLTEGEKRHLEQLETEIGELDESRSILQIRSEDSQL